MWFLGDLLEPKVGIESLLKVAPGEPDARLDGRDDDHPFAARLPQETGRGASDDLPAGAFGEPLAGRAGSSRSPATSPRGDSVRRAAPRRRLVGRPALFAPGFARPGDCHDFGTDRSPTRAHFRVIVKSGRRPREPRGRLDGTCLSGRAVSSRSAGTPGRRASAGAPPAAGLRRAARCACASGRPGIFSTLK